MKYMRKYSAAGTRNRVRPVPHFRLSARSTALDFTFDHAPIGLAQITPDGRWQRVNQRFCAIFGYTAQELHHLSWKDLVHPDELDSVLAQVTQLESGEAEELKFEKRHIRKDGSIMWLHVTISMAPKQGGKPRYGIVALEDITKRKHAEDERAQADAREQEALRRLAAIQSLTDAALAHLNLDELLNSILERLHEVMNVDNAAILLLDPDGTHLTVRAARGLEEAVAAEVHVPFGVGVAGTIASTRAPLIIDDLRQANPHSEFLRKEMRSLVGVPLIVEDRVIGVIHIDTATQRTFTQEDADLLQLVADRVALAIDRARLFESLVQSEERFRTTFEQAASGIAHISLDGHFLQVNAKWSEITGYTSDELLALTFQDITYPPDLDADVTLLRRLAAGEISTYTIEKRYIRKDASLIWINLTVAPVRDDGGAPRYFISVIEDITERKQLNELLEARVQERTKQLQEVNAELESFAYSVSHDLRAPLRAMQGFAQALQEDYDDILDDTGRMYTTRIGIAAGRMDMLIQDLLAYGRLSRSEVRLSPVDLNDVIADAMNALEGEIRERDATIQVDRPLPRLYAHYATLAQVVTNLLSNAIKFIAPGVKPSVRVFAQSQREGERTWARLWIEDNGIGIDQAHQERIFRVFERLHGVETYPGTGIGLAIVRKGIERMGGRAGVESQVNRGSRFWIELPQMEE